MVIDNNNTTTISKPIPFQNFIGTLGDYKFVDMAIAKDESLDWSYSSWPSHFDHIIITNELFGNHIETTSLNFKECNSSYSFAVSDHRPVMVRLAK